MVSVYSINLSSDTSFIFLASLSKSRKKFWKQKLKLKLKMKKRRIFLETKARNCEGMKREKMKFKVV